MKARSGAVGGEVPWMGWCCAAGPGAQGGGRGGSEAPATAGAAADAAAAAAATVVGSGGVEAAVVDETAARAIPTRGAASAVHVAATARPADGGERVAQPRGGRGG